MNKIYIAALTDYTEKFTEIFTASSENLLLKKLEDSFCNEVTFNTKEDVEKHLKMYEDELDVDMEVEYKVEEID